MNPNVGQQMADQFKASIQDVVIPQVLKVFTDNIGWFVAIFTFYLAMRFGPEILRWFRRRNEPKQLSLFD